MGDAAPIAFRDLIAPLAPEEFFSRVYGQAARHLPGDAARFERVFSWAECNRLLGMTKLWSERTMKLVLDGRDVDPQGYSSPGLSREGTRVLVPDPRAVEALLERGATLVLDLAETLSPGLAAVMRALASWTGGVAFCNVYCSWKAHQGFLTHYDTTEVFALHIAGTKRWRFYEGRALNPIDAPGHDYSSLPPAHHRDARGAVTAEAEMSPGDVLYLPRGLYHEAVAASEASLHVSFGVSRATGLDVDAWLRKRLVADPRFRAEFPHFDDAAGLRLHLRGMAGALAEHLGAESTASELREWLRARAFRDGLGRFALPARGGQTMRRVRPGSARVTRAPDRLESAGGAIDLEAGEAEIVEWVLGQDFVDVAALRNVFSGIEASRARDLLERLEGAGAVEPI